MPTLSLSMIVKDAERDLPACLESAQGVVDEIVVADTGSRDASVEIATKAGARVIAIPWENDFSKARNLSLAEAKSDWVLVLDADERLEPRAAAKIPSLLANAAMGGYQVTLRNYVTSLGHKVWDRSAVRNDSGYAPAKDYAGYVDHENVRLFRHDPEIYFTGRVHETVGWRLLSLNRNIGSSGLIVHHMGMVRPAEERARKILFYRDLGKQKVADMPENSQAHFELGLAELENLGNAREALASFHRACQLNPKLGVGWFFTGVCHFRLGAFAEALDCFRRAEACGHITPWLAEMAGDCRYNLGQYTAAETCYRRGLKRDPGSAPLLSKLGLVETRIGNSAAGLRKIRQAIDADAKNPELHDRLIMAEVWLHDLARGAEAAEAKLEAVTPTPDDFLRAASIRSKMRDTQRATAILREGVKAFPESEILRTKLCEVETVFASKEGHSSKQ